MGEQLCDWCKKNPVHHIYEVPKISLCCQCMDEAVEHSAFMTHEDIKNKLGENTTARDIAFFWEILTRAEQLRREVQKAKLREGGKTE